MYDKVKYIQSNQCLIIYNETHYFTHKMGENKQHMYITPINDSAFTFCVFFFLIIFCVTLHFFVSSK